MIKLRDYQLQAVDIGVKHLEEYGIVYYFGAPRIGKTLVALRLCQKIEANRVLVVTKKIAIPSILHDADLLGMDIDIINYESVSKFTKNKYDIIIYDEVHQLKSYPKKTKRLKDLTPLIKQALPTIYLSATPAIESLSGIYHQLYTSAHSPFADFQNFYKWAHFFVNIKLRRTSYGLVNDYSDANKAMIEPYVNPFVVRISQKDAGFETWLDLKEDKVELPAKISEMITTITKDRVLEVDGETIVADTAVSIMSKVHQLTSGSIIDVEGTRHIIDRFKIEHVKNTYTNSKIAIFYKFIAEREMLLDAFPNAVTTPEEFNADPKATFVGQIKTSSEGVNLSTAEYLIFITLDYSGTTYTQVIDRASYKDRENPPKIRFITTGGIDSDILSLVMNKEQYNLKLFKKDFLIS